MIFNKLIIVFKWKQINLIFFNTWIFFDYIIRWIFLAKDKKRSRYSNTRISVNTMKIHTIPIQRRRVMRKRIMLCAAALICAGAGFQATSLAQNYIKNDDLVCNGESFFQASNICSELSRLARADGYLQSGNFKQIAVSGANISQILGFYKRIC